MRMFALLLMVMAVGLPVFGQGSATDELKTFTLTSPYAEDGHGKLKPSDKANRNCFDLVSETEVRCGSRWDLLYGNMRAGEEWDWFHVSDANGVRTRIVSLGEKEWTDRLKVPIVEPYPVLLPGEQRTITVDASGADGLPGLPGRAGSPGRDAGDRTASMDDRDELDVPRQPGPPPRKPVKVSDHYTKVEKGNIYVVRVTDDVNDFYVLMRVDDLVRGRAATISWKRIDGPTQESAETRKK